MKKVLVTDGEQRAALAVVRSLARAGYHVQVCSARRHCLAAASRHCRQHTRVANALTHPTEFAADVRALCARAGIDVLLPITEASLRVLLSTAHIIPGVVLPFPSRSAFEGVSDKTRVLEVATRLGLNVPRQHVVQTRADARALTHDMNLPVVIKPARSVASEDGHGIKCSVAHAATFAQLQEKLAALPDAAFPVLVQQRIVGPGVGVFALMWDARVRALFAHRRIREKPPAGGVSVYSESLAADPRLVDRAVELLRAFDWQGVAMVEFKYDQATGMPYLMEVNGRFWGSLQLAIDAGVDFPRLLLECASGAPAGAPPPYRAAVRSRWWWGEVDHLIARVRQSRAQLDLPSTAPGGVAALRDFLSWRANDRADVFRLSDPAPLFRETIDWLARR